MDQKEVWDAFMRATAENPQQAERRCCHFKIWKFGVPHVSRLKAPNVKKEDLRFYYALKYQGFLAFDSERKMLVPDFDAMEDPSTFKKRDPEVAQRPSDVPSPAQYPLEESIHAGQGVSRAEFEDLLAKQGAELYQELKAEIDRLNERLTQAEKKGTVPE